MAEGDDEGSMCAECPHKLSQHDVEITREGARLLCAVKGCKCEIKAKMKGLGK